MYLCSYVTSFPFPSDAAQTLTDSVILTPSSLVPLRFHLFLLCPVLSTCFFFHSPQWSVRKPRCQQSVSDSLTSGVSASVTEDLTVCLPCVCPSSHQSLCDTKGTCWCGAQTCTLTDQGSAVGMATLSEKHSKNDSKKGGKKI